MVEARQTALFIPPELRKVKLALFERIGETIRRAGGRVVRGDHSALSRLPEDVIPIVGCTPALTPIIQGWRERNRPWIYWDRGYWLRVYATWLPRGTDGGMYRWHLNSYQLQALRDVPDDRLRKRPPPVAPWSKGGGHIVVAIPTPTYERFHAIEGWTERTLRQLAVLSDRQVVVRDKESKRSLADDVRGAHCLVSHGSNAAVEAVIMGCPVVVDPSSAAALVGRTDLKDVERPVYPDREPWLRSLAYSQFDERELVDGTLWRHIA